MVAAELAKVYHTVKHHHSYNSSDCGSKLDPVIYPDSAIAKKLACGRTKSEAIVTNVLAPKSVETIMNGLSNGRYFSLSTDASNMKNRKLFPVCLQYFTLSGIQKKLLDFIEQNDESSSEIADMLISCLGTYNLSVNNVSGYSADNASVNYGCKKSVFTALKALNKNIIKANCNSHVVHNTLRKVTDIFDCDIETIVTSVYGHFSISANRRVDLQSFFAFVDLEFHDLLRHVPTRWLSLGPAIERLLKSWPALLSYFKSMGTDCPKRIAKCLGLPASGSNEQDDGDIQLSITEAYLHFSLNLCNVFEKTVLQLESDSVTFCELYSIMSQLRDKLKDRLTDRFFGAAATKILDGEDMPRNKKVATENNFCDALERGIAYLEKWFDFDDKNVACMLQSLSLKDVAPTFQQVKNICAALHLTVDLDDLYDELSTHKEALRSIAESSKPCQSVADKWVQFLTACDVVPPVLYRVVSYVLSLPGSNAFPERIFSLMNAKWRDDRNRMSVELVKAELQVFANFTQDCQNFYSLVIGDQKLLDTAASNTKYKFKAKSAPGSTENK